MTACAIDGSNAYLAIPDNPSELAALVADGDVWVGISDSTTEGTYQTVRGAIATFLPWGPSEPDNNGNQDCVGALQASSKIETLACTTMRPALCECEP
ncbi:MAG: C-type lectin domain-containing protein [Deltaproteobacteria bacterium]|nr:C-type lectin domain-containing protein [Deltaproteobacteria bacterium]